MSLINLSKFSHEIKISLEDEGLTFEQACAIACKLHRTGTAINMKIGGAEAISDMRFADMIGCDGCVAPMIESPYALKKFISSIFRHKFDFKRLYMIFESQTSYDKRKEIFESSDMKHLNGIVLGRSDFIQSYGKSKEHVDSDFCFEKAKNIFTLAKAKNLTTIMGGNISINSQKFVTDLYKENLLDYVETRNVKIKLNDYVIDNLAECIKSAILFEIEFLKSKYEKLTFLANTDQKRISNLELRNR